jgi:hypothetical protein
MNGLRAPVEKYSRDMKFLFAYVTRVTYKTCTLHRCAGISSARGWLRGRLVWELGPSRTECTRAREKSPADVTSPACSEIRNPGIKFPSRYRDTSRQSFKPAAKPLTVVFRTSSFGRLHLRRESALRHPCSGSLALRARDSLSSSMKSMAT